MLINARDTYEVAQGGKFLSLPVKGNTTIYQGALVALDDTGYAVPGSKQVGLTAAGRAEETVENAGGDGAACIQVRQGAFCYANSTDAPVTQAHVLKQCYIQDDETVSSSAEGASAAGIVIRIDEDGVAVRIG